MQYLVSVITDGTAVLASPEEDAAIDVFNDRLRAEGHWVFGGGLASPGAGGDHPRPPRGVGAGGRRPDPALR
jgi:hypothetical protein